MGQRVHSGTEQELSLAMPLPHPGHCTAPVVYSVPDMGTTEKDAAHVKTSTTDGRKYVLPDDLLKLEPVKRQLETIVKLVKGETAQSISTK